MHEIPLFLFNHRSNNTLDEEKKACENAKNLLQLIQEQLNKNIFLK